MKPATDTDRSHTKHTPRLLSWFKDGRPLLGVAEAPEADEAEISVERANEFSSTLTIRKIRPAHSGHYTW